MADSDVRVTPDMLPTIAAEFQDPRAGPGHLPLPRRAGPQLLVHAGGRWG